MRLLNVETLQLEVFDGGPRVTFAILSHTWGEEEVSFQDMMSFSSPLGLAPPLRAVESKRGFSKIVKCCAKARSEGYQYVWIDTCCIDKSSSAELSEAINSMFKWYHEAEVCYAFLSDVVVGGHQAVGEEYSLDEGGRQTDDWKKGFHKSRWFTRGWTLQELLAPLEMVFVDSQWREFGTRDTLAGMIEEITGIDMAVLRMEKSPGEFSVAQRMSWAANRNTTRIEDEAYCLMGLFDVGMPLLYGEGRKAFKRLQLEIMKQSTDRSILAWASNDSHGVIEGVLASSPAMFEDCGGINWAPSLLFPGLSRGEGDGNLNYNACHDIIGFSLKLEVGLLEPPPSGGTPMVFREYWDFADEDGVMLPSPPKGECDHPLAADLVHFPRDVGELYTHERAFREFDYGFLRHKGRTVVLVMLDGCTKGGRDTNSEYTVGITLCLGAEGLMKRVHFPSRFLIPEHATSLFTDRIQTLHASLSGNEVLQQPALPNFEKCMVRVPDMSELPYELAYTIPAMARNSAGIWYLERWGEITDQASLDLQPCFSLHRTGTGRAMAFLHKADPSLSFLIIFTLVKPPSVPRSTTSPSISRESSIGITDSLTSSFASLTSSFNRTFTTSPTTTNKFATSSNRPSPRGNQWFQVSFIAGPKALEVGFEADLASVLPPPSTTPIYSWQFDLPDPSLTLSVKIRKAPKVYNAGLKNYNALLRFTRRSTVGHDSAPTDGAQGWRKDAHTGDWVRKPVGEGGGLE